VPDRGLRRGVLTYQAPRFAALEGVAHAGSADAQLPRELLLGGQAPFEAPVEDRFEDCGARPIGDAPGRSRWIELQLHDILGMQRERLRGSKGGLG
jgi:hypothetical protein